MKKKFYPIKKWEMERFLRRFGGEELSPEQYEFKRPEGRKINEYIYLIKLTRFAALEVFTSIDKDTDVARDVGEDAIRVLPVRLPNLIPVAKKSSNSQRIKTWKTNVNLKISEILSSKLGHEIKCENCGGLMELKMNRRKETRFIGCSNYSINQCGNTKNIPWDLGLPTR